MSTGDSSSFNFRNLFHLLSAGSFLIQIFLTVFCLVTSHIHFTYSAPKSMLPSEILKIYWAIRSLSHTFQRFRLLRSFFLLRPSSRFQLTARRSR